jgi:hypothetical protein
MLCQKCRNNDEIYQIQKRIGKFLDVERISRFFGTSHLDVRADKTQKWPTQKIWMMSGMEIQIYTMYRWPTGKLLKKENPKFWADYMEIFDDGIIAESARLWDAIENQSRF